MNHAQARAPMQKEAAMQAIYQFLHDQGLVGTAECLAEESSVAYDPEALANEPSTLLTALTQYENQRSMAFRVQRPDEETRAVQQWIQSLRDNAELYPTYQLRQLQTHTANVICCKFQPKPHSQLFVSGSVDKSVALCSADSNTVLRRIPVSGPVLSLHFNPAHPNLLLATCMNGGHSIVDIDKPEQQEVLANVVEHKKYVVTGKWNPAGTHYVTGSHDASVHVYGPASGSAGWKQLGRLEFTNNVESVEWIDSANFYVAVREDNYLHQVRVDADGGVREVAKHNVNEYGDDHVSFNVLDMALSPAGGKAILLATDHHRVICMQVGSSHQIRNFYNVQNDGYSTPRLAWSPTGKYAFVTCQDKSIAVLDIAKGQTVHKLTGHEINVRDVSMQPHSNRLVSCSFDKSCRVWTTEVE